MSKETNKLIPDLRFPEFVNEGEWIKVTIESVGDVVTGGTPSKEEDEYWGGDFVWVTAQDFKEKYIYDSVLKLTKKGKGKSRVIPKNSVLVTCIASIGLNGINKVECATNQQINSIVCNSLNNYEFVYYAISKNITRLKNMAGQTAVPIISKSIFEKFTIQKPQKPNEQQKIASCLSSLDEVIAAHSQKLDLLKDHKKGLMQNLFPQEGETVPKFRFKEFDNDGEWVEKTLDSLTTKISDGIHTTPNYDDKGEFYFINGNNLIDGKIWIDGKTKRVSEEEYNSHKRDLSKSTILLSINGTIGNIAVYNNEKVILGKSACYINVNRTKADKTFIVYFIQTDYIKSYFNSELTGSTIKNLSLKSIKETIIKIPIKPIEQQKIASCLSALDALIAAQGDKIEQLKLHKKGLDAGVISEKCLNYDFNDSMNTLIKSIL